VQLSVDVQFFHKERNHIYFSRCIFPFRVWVLSKILVIKNKHQTYLRNTVTRNSVHFNIAYVLTQQIQSNFKVFHSAHFCTSNTSAVSQSNAHLYLIHIFITILLLFHLFYMFRCITYTIFREDFILLALRNNW